MRIYIDNREKNRTHDALIYYKKYATVVTELRFGDYIFLEDGGDFKVVFEYKTIDDFLHSIKDHRVFNQALNQSNNYDYHFVIIVGSEKDEKEAKQKMGWYSKNYMSNGQINGAIASLVNFTSVLRVRNQSLAFDLMERIALKCLSDKPVVKRYPKNRGVPAYRFLCNNVNGIADKTAERIVKELGLWSICDVLRLNRERLMSVGGVGGKKADSILRQILGEYS